MSCMYNRPENEKFKWNMQVFTDSRLGRKHGIDIGVRHFYKFKLTTDYSNQNLIMYDSMSVSLITVQLIMDDSMIPGI